jgi:hypothetical protein
MQFTASFSKVWFILSVVVLSFLYGGAVGKWEWFPYSYISQATNQARSIYRSFRTNPPNYTNSRIYDRSGVRLVNPERIQPGMNLVLGTWEWEEGSGKLEPGAKLIDRKGRTVHKWHPDLYGLFETDSLDLGSVEFMGSHLFSNGDILLNAHRVGTVRLDACGKVLWRVKEGSHHSIARAADGSLWIPGGSSDHRTSTPKYPDGAPGINSPVLMDQILHVSADGA